MLRGMKSQLLPDLDNSSYFGCATSTTLTQRQIPLVHVQAAPPRAQCQSRAQIVTNSDLATARKASLEQLLEKHDDMFSNSQAAIECVSIKKHFTNLSNNVPIRRTSYRSLQSDQVEIRKKVESLLQQGLIRLSLSPYAPPVFMPEKRRQDTPLH